MSAFAGLVLFSGAANGQLERMERGLVGEALERASLRRFGGGGGVFRQQIITPEDRWERQPSVGSASGVVSMFDGRLDNRAELLAELGATSTMAAPLPDGEIARLCYERWGADSVPRLLGEFAWAVWDDRAHRLMLARDYSIYRSLYYARIPGGIAFATAYRPLLALPEISRDLDETAVADLLVASMQDDDSTIYRAISWVRPAGRVLIDGDRLNADRYWEPKPQPTLKLPRDEDYVEAAREVFERAIHCRLRRIGPAVVSLSGGHDSSAIAATLSRNLAPETVHGLTMVPAAEYNRDRSHGSYVTDTYVNERPLVQSLASQYPNLSVDYLSCPKDHPLEMDASRSLLAATQIWTPFANGVWHMPVLERAAQLGTRTVFSGGYGNWTFSLDRLCQVSELWQGGNRLSALREVALARRWLVPGRWRAVLRSLAKLQAPGLLALSRRLRGINGVREWESHLAINPDFYHARGFKERVQQHGARFLKIHSPGGYVRGLKYIISNSRLQVDTVLALRTTSGVDQRDPYIDRRVMEFCLSLPPDQFMRDGMPRRLSRRMFADRLPPEILMETRRGVQNTDWFLRLDCNRDAIAAELDRFEASPLACRLLDVPTLKRMLAALPRHIADAEEERHTYKDNFTRALRMGRFLSWYEGGNYPGPDSGL